MSKIQIFIVSMIFTLLVTSCAPQFLTPTPPPVLTEEPGIPVTGVALVQSLEVQMPGSQPLQVNAILRGQLPDGVLVEVESLTLSRALPNRERLKPRVTWPDAGFGVGIASPSGGRGVTVGETMNAAGVTVRTPSRSTRPIGPVTAPSGTDALSWRLEMWRTVVARTPPNSTARRRWFAFADRGGARRRRSTSWFRSALHKSRTSRVGC